MGRPKKQTSSQRGMRAVIYLRVSTAEQAKPGHYGLDAQDHDAWAYCERAGYQVITTQVDAGISGTAPIEQRPGLAAALALCEAGAADVLVVAKQDRLARKSGVFDAIKGRAVSGHYRIETAKDGQNVIARANRIPVETMQFVASIEAILIAERLYGGRQERSRRDGRGSGPLPWGYTCAADGAIEVDRRAQQVICRLLTLRNTCTYQATADTLNAEGYTTPKGSRWTVGQVYAIERHGALYRTGVRRWDGITAQQRWPILVFASSDMIASA